MEYVIRHSSKSSGETNTWMGKTFISLFNAQRQCRVLEEKNPRYEVWIELGGEKIEDVKVYVPIEI